MSVGQRVAIINYTASHGRSVAGVSVHHFYCTAGVSPLVLKIRPRLGPVPTFCFGFVGYTDILACHCMDMLLINSMSCRPYETHACRLYCVKCRKIKCN